MVQVDIVWAYAFGATFAAAAGRQLEKEEKPFVNKWYVFLLIFLSVFFAPSGLYLLWEHTQWETMQVATTMKDIPAWLVVIFAVTNVTQGILGYWTTLKLVKKEELLRCPRQLDGGMDHYSGSSSCAVGTAPGTSDSSMT